MYNWEDEISHRFLIIRSPVSQAPPASARYNGDLTAKENGYVGGYMVKKMIEDYEKQSAGMQKPY